MSNNDLINLLLYYFTYIQQNITPNQYTYKYKYIQSSLYFIIITLSLLEPFALVRDMIQKPYINGSTVSPAKIVHVSFVINIVNWDKD